MLISVDQLYKKFGIKIKGVLHLGAHQAEEASAYKQAGASKVIWIEGNPELMPVLETELKKYSNQFVYNVLVSDTDGQTVNFNVTNNFQSSSILDLGSHKEHHPEITVHHTLSLKTQRLDSFFKKNNIDLSECNFLNIDLQGAELLAMKGLGNYLDNIKYIYTEINTGSVYKGCPTLFEMDSFLHQKGFYRIATELTKWEWGDAFYIKNDPGPIQKVNNLLSASYYQSIGFITTSTNNVYTKTRKLLGKVKRRIFPTDKKVVNPNSNGEGSFLSQIVKNAEGKIVIFDVGANVGEYTKMILNELKKQGKSNYEIHMFEPQNKCYQILFQEFCNNPSIRINNFALSDSAGQADIHYDFSGSSSASLFNRQEISLPKTETVQLKKLETYMTENHIKKVDLLKIDTEGNEKKVLLGGNNLLQPNCISAIQFEYGGTYLDAGITLAEVVQMLINKGYFVGKLRENDIEYKEELGAFTEDYAYSNYVATDKKIR